MSLRGIAIAVDDWLELSPYQQIVAQIQALIERGELAPEAPLPTVRQLARDLGVAPNTVARAYADLQSAGWLVGEGRRGTRVASRTPNADNNARARALQTTVAQLIDGLKYRGFTMQEIRQEIARTLETASH